MFCVVCDAGEFEGCNSVLQAGFYIRFRWLRVSPQMILQLNHTRVHNPQAAPLSLPPHHFQWAVTVTSLVSGGGGRREERRGGGLAAAGESATSPPRCFQTHSGWGVERNGAEPWASFKNLTLLLPTTRWFTALESPLAELWRYEPRTRCSTKVSFLFLTCLKQRERNIFFSCPGVPLAARVSGARRQSPNKLFLRGGGREEKRRILDSQQPPVFFFFRSIRPLVHCVTVKNVVRRLHRGFWWCRAGSGRSVSTPPHGDEPAAGCAISGSWCRHGCQN